eukprot:c7936_g1_i1.p1 GENE.c7936_g1_i1~~c7936_g1_i1.p1  ORF type:complete len:233 (-),score=45.81 c7936_g1_i1:108-806(-)
MRFTPVVGSSHYCTLSENGTIATRNRGYNNCVVATSQPLPLSRNGLFFDVVIQGISQFWAGGLELGLAQDPSKPAVLIGNAGFCHAKLWHPESACIGDHISVHCTPSGHVGVWVNNRPGPYVATHIKPWQGNWFGVCGVYGMTTSVKLVSTKIPCDPHEQWDTFLMGTHPRVGKKSPIALLHTDLRELILRHFVSAEPQKFLIAHEHLGREYAMGMGHRAMVPTESCRCVIL